MNSLKLDLLIIGGGIAGLWCLNRAKQAGYSSLLLEKDKLGGGQTICSQGIIHGGAKYSLTGNLSQATQSIAAMPERWYQCLQGQGEINLSRTKLLSDTHYLWSINSLSSKVTAFFASKAMKNKATKIRESDYPEAFKHKEFRGNLYALNERVVDVPSLIANLSEPCADSIRKLDILEAGKIIQTAKGGIEAIELEQHQLRIEPQRVLFTCGEAYTAFKEKLSIPAIKMQKRPLHMVTVRQQDAPEIFAHAIGASSKPLLTITSHRHSSGDLVWHIGGLIAEDGVAKDREGVIEDAKAKINEYLPWITLSNPSWDSYRVNRAEPEMQGQIRPDASYLKNHDNCMIAWPTKLALAPQLSDIVLDQLSNLSPVTDSDATLLDNLPTPTLAPPVWEQGNWEQENN